MLEAKEQEFSRINSKRKIRNSFCVSCSLEDNRGQEGPHKLVTPSTLEHLHLEPGSPSGTAFTLEICQPGFETAE